MRPFTAIVVTLLGAGTAWGQAGWTTSPAVFAPAEGGSSVTRLVVAETGNALHLSTRSGPIGLDLVATYFHVAGPAWSLPTTIAQGAIVASMAALDDDGDAVVLFSRDDGPGQAFIFVTRFHAASGVWDSPTRLSDPIVPAAPLTPLAIGFPTAGGVTVVFTVAGVPKVSRTSGISGPWSPAQTLFAAMQTQAAAVELDGDVLLAGADFQAVRVAACSPSAMCAPPVTVQSISSGFVPTLTLDVNGAGGMALVWEHGIVEAATRSPQGVWSTATTLTSPGASNGSPSVGIDDAGNAVVAWQRFQPPLPGGTWLVQARRFDAGDAAWGATQTLSTAAIGPPAVAVSAGGSAIAAWRERPAAAAVVAAARFSADTGQWDVARPLPTLGVPVADPAAGADAAGNAMATWRAAAGNVSGYLFARWRAAPASPTIAAVAPATGLLQISFTPPATVETALAPTSLDYSLDGGMTWTPRAPAGVASPLEISGLTDGVTYDLRLRSVSAAGAGPASGALPVRSGSGLDTVPAGLRVASRAGNAVTFTWLAPSAGVVPTGYLIEGSISGQSQVLASVPTGGAATQVTLAVPDGTFDVRVTAVRGAMRLATSLPLQVAVNTLAFPSSPINLLASAAGDTLALSWTNTWSGATLTGLQLLVGGSAGATITLPVTESFTYSGVRPGNYTFAVTALNGGAPGGATSTVQLTFPGTCAGPPNPPTAFSLSTQVGRVYLNWLPPASGPAVTHYLIQAMGAFTGSFPLTARTFSAPVPPGSYSVSVASVGPCGTSAATAAQTVVVP